MSTHFGRDAKKYYDKPLYKAINNFCFVDFEFEVLCECDRADLIEKEQFYYDILKPTYNLVRPAKNNFIYESVRKKAIESSTTPQMLQRRSALYNTEKYQIMFRNNTKHKMRAVDMFENCLLVKSFECLQDASRFITEHTDYKGKNKTSKIKAVCDGERNSAYGYNWKYSKV